MRPLKLTMTAFGPYADTQSIDFRPLNERAFFLIHGPTGAGKTTILDAICFALYGETSGNERKGEQMRSHHAKMPILTEVTFDFLLGQEAFRITRSLKRERSGDSSTEISYKPDKATLWRRSGIETEQVPGTVLASKWKKVTEKIEGLLGFESNQFRQVIVLPQDQFQKLLMANSQSREDLFKTLFQTEQYEQIEKALRDEAKHLADELKNLREKLKLILSLAQVSTIDELVEKRREVVDNLKGKNSELTLLRDKEQLASDQFISGQETERKIEERERSETELQTLQSRQGEFNAKRQKLARAQHAAEIVDLENATEQQRKEAVDLGRKQIDAQTQLENSQKMQLAAADALERELKRDKERDDARRENDRLIALQGLVQELETARHDFDLAEGRVTLAFVNRSGSQTYRDRLKIELGQLEEDLAQVENVKLKLLATQQAETAAQEVYDRWQKLREIARRWKTAQETEARTYERLQRAETDLEQAREKRNKLEDAWHAGQAAIFASQLKENSPCPVCGSIHHPQPAISDQPLPSEIDLKNARSFVIDLERLYPNAQAEFSRCHDETVRLDAERTPLVELLGEKAHLPLIEIQSELKSAQSNRKSAEEADRHLSDLKENVEPLKMKLAQAEANFAELDLSWQETSKGQTTAQAIFSERERNVPHEFNDMGKLKMAQELAKARVTQLDLALERSQANDLKANEEVARPEATLKQISERTIIEGKRAEDLKQLFLERIKAAGFLDLEDYHSAKLQPPEIILLDTEIREYEGQLQAARDRVERAIQSAGSLTKPDLEKLKAEFQDARRKVDEVLKLIQALENQDESYKKNLEQLTQVQDDFNRIEKQYTVIGKIADVANGKNAFNLTFQRFVLSALLDDVLSDATQRLKIMSRGRYILQRAQSPLDKRRASGLDLVISDTWTGDSTRSVETLSGGEGFYTSLALALGLAEVVQHYAGGIRLDTIFVDEGFGSLDADTLDLAIRTLEGLKEGGRIVGIISHVESLRERIPARLEVTAGVNGSCVKLMIG
jgi:DNA repair protein SbcC/Rad50